MQNDDGKEFERVVRGGGCLSFPMSLGIQKRLMSWPSERAGNLGFRLVRPMTVLERLVEVCRGVE